MKLIKNVGKTDQTLRLAAGGVLVLGAIVSHTWLPAVLGLILLATGASGTCPAYMPFDINTNKEGED